MHLNRQLVTPFPKKKVISKAKTILITLFITSILTRYKIIKLDRDRYSKTEWKRIKFKYWILELDSSKLFLE